MKNFLIALSVLVTGCATYTKPVEQKIEKQFTINKSYDQTWAAVIKYFSTKNIPIKTIEKSSGLVVSDKMNIDIVSTADIFDCGTYSGESALGNAKTGLGHFNIFIETKNKNETTITINSEAELIGTVPAAVYGSYVQSKNYSLKCFSKGTFEKGLAEFVSK